MQKVRGRVVVSIRRGEFVQIGDDIEILIADSNRAPKIRFYIIAPKELKVTRGKRLEEDYADKGTKRPS